MCLCLGFLGGNVCAAVRVFAYMRVPVRVCVCPYARLVCVRTEFFASSTDMFQKVLAVFQEGWGRMSRK